MVGEILGRNHFLLQEVIQVIDIGQIGLQLRADQFHRGPHGLPFMRPVDDSLQRECNRNTRDDRKQFVQEIPEPILECLTRCHGYETKNCSKIVFLTKNVNTFRKATPPDCPPGQAPAWARTRRRALS